MDLDALSPDEQLELAEQLWERLGQRPELLPLSGEIKPELDVRDEALDRDVAAGRAIGIPWQEVLRRIRQR